MSDKKRNFTFNGKTFNINKEEVRQSVQYDLQGLTSNFSTELKLEDIKISNEKAFNALSEGDEKPFFFLVEIKFGEQNPATDGSIYTDIWADSYLEGLNEKPYPGSKNGHIGLYSSETVDNHTYVIGGQKVSNDTMVLKHYVPSNETTLIREIKAGLKATSVVDYHRVAIVEDEDGDWQEYVLDSMKGQRNDIIEWDLGGMATSIVTSSQKADINRDKGDINMAKEKVEKASYGEALEIIQEQSKMTGFSGQKIGEDLSEKLGFTVMSSAQKEKLEKIEEFEKTSQKDVLTVIDEFKAEFDKNFEEIKAQKIKESCKDYTDGVKSAVEFALKDFKSGQKEELDGAIRSSLESDYVKGIASKEMDSTYKSGQKSNSGSSADYSTYEA